MAQKGFEIGGGWVPGRLFNEAVSAAGITYHKDEYVPYFLAHKTHCDFALEILEKK